jgi:hypothetical protein
MLPELVGIEGSRATSGAIGTFAPERGIAALCHLNHLLVPQHRRAAAKRQRDGSLGRASTATCSPLTVSGYREERVLPHVMMTPLATSP